MLANSVMTDDSLDRSTASDVPVEVLPTANATVARPTVSRTPQWPSPLGADAFHGLAGRIVGAIEPHTEADPVALLLQYLVFFSNVMGRSPHFIVEATTHALNLFAVLVGATSKGRKGTALDHVRRLFAEVDPGWSGTRIQSGLSSGEGLIFAVRDSSAADPGVSDKRLLVIEAEFASTLRMLNRDGNVLSPTVRQAWDSGELRVLTKNSPIMATGAHISMIGHISAGELRKELDSSSAANGFANRYLFACVQRSKLLPEGGYLNAVDLAPLIDELRAAVAFARHVSELKRDSGARDLWHSVYPELSAGKTGLHGSVTARSEAQVMRLACVYALQDLAMTISCAHLRAALALWRYVDDSVLFLFGDALGNPLADQLLRTLRQKPAEGLSRTEIRDLFGRHQSQVVIDEVLNVLADKGLVRSEVLATGGRPQQRWFPIL